MRIYQGSIWLALVSVFLHISMVAARRSSGRSSSSRSSSSSNSRSSSRSSWGSSSSPSYSSSSSYKPSSSWGSNSSPSYSSSSSYKPSSSPSYSSSSSSYSPNSSWRSNSNPSSSSSSSSSSPSSSRRSNSSPSYSSNSRSSSWRSNSSPSYSSSSSSSSSPSSTSYGFRWGSSSSPNSISSSSNWRNIGSSSFSSSSNRGTTGNSNNAGSSSYSSSTSNFKPSGRSWGNTESTKSSSNTSGSGLSSSSRSPSYSSSSSSNNSPSSSSSKHKDNSKSGSKDKGIKVIKSILNFSPSSSSSKHEDNSKSGSKDKGIEVIKSILNFSPSSSSSKHEENSKSGSKQKGTGENKNISKYGPSSSSSKHEKNSKSSSKALSSASNTPSGSSNTNAESSSSSSQRPNNNVHSGTVFDVIRNRNIIRNATASGNNSNNTYGSYYRLSQQNQTILNNPINPSGSMGSMVQNINAMPLPTTINLNNNQRSAAGRPYYADTYHSYSNYDDRSLETPPYSREDDSNDGQGSYYTTEWPASSRQNYLPIDKGSKKVKTETEQVCRNVIQGEYNERDVYVESIKKICEPEAMKGSDAPVIEQHTQDDSKYVTPVIKDYDKLTQSEIHKRYAKLEHLKEICEAELARTTTTQTPIETTTMPPTSTTYFIDYKNRKPSKLVIMPTLEGATNCRKVMQSDFNEEGQIVDIVKEICDPPTTTTETPITTYETMITDDVFYEILTAIDELIPHELIVSTSINNSVHRKHGSNPLEIICAKVMHIEVIALADIAFVTTTMPPTSTSHYFDYTKRKPSKLVIITSQEDGPNCRKIMNSELNEEGEIVDTVTQICDPSTTTTEATTTTAINTADRLISIFQ